MPNDSRKYLARQITEFVNCDANNPRCLPKQFIEKYGIPRFRSGPRDAAWVAQMFRMAWDKTKHGHFAANIEQVFADRQTEVFAEMDKGSTTVHSDETRLPHWSDAEFERNRAAILKQQEKVKREVVKQLRREMAEGKIGRVARIERISRKGVRFAYARGTFPAELLKYTRPAFQVVPGKRVLVFEPRDLLDRMAWELVRALATRRLRRCSGENCPTPLFVAYHSKQKYCYRGCGAQALSDWTAEWHRRRKAKGRRRARAA